MKALGFATIILFSPLTLLASNGGDAIVCYDRPFSSKAKIIRAQLKDFWEHSQTSVHQLDIPAQGNFTNRARKILERLSQVDPIRGKRLLEKLENITQTVAFLDDSSIQEVDDSTSRITSVEMLNCYDRQAAVQIQNPGPYEKAILIDGQIFDKMDENHKAGLILHELLYQEAVSFAGEKNSDRTREFNFLINSSYMNDLNVLSYTSDLARLKMNFGRGEFVINGLQVSQNRSNQLFELLRPAILELKNLTLDGSSRIRADVESVFADKSRKLETEVLNIHPESIKKDFVLNWRPKNINYALESSRADESSVAMGMNLYVRIKNKEAHQKVNLKVSALGLIAEASGKGVYFSPEQISGEVVSMGGMKASGAHAGFHINEKSFTSRFPFVRSLISLEYGDFKLTDSSQKMECSDYSSPKEDHQILQCEKINQALITLNGKLIPVPKNADRLKVVKKGLKTQAIYFIERNSISMVSHLEIGVLLETGYSDYPYAVPYLQMIQGQPLKFKRYGITFHENGMVKLGCLMDQPEVSLVDVRGKSKKYKPTERKSVCLDFDEKGFVVGKR